MKKIVIAAEVFSSNLGDYAIYDSLSTLLSSRDIEAIPLDISFRRGFPVSSTDSKSKLTNSSWKSLIPKKIKHHKLTQYMITHAMWYLVHRQDITNYWSELISSSDAVIIGGGQLLTDTSAGFLTKLALITDIANEFNKPICILGCGVGSELSSKAQKNVKKVLNSAKFVSLRDSDSSDRLKSLIKNDISLNVYPDLAFSLSSSANNDLDKKILEQKKKVCGFNVMPLNAFKKYNPNLKDVDSDTYIDFWKRLAYKAKKENIRIHIMTNGSIQDYEQAESIYSSMLSEGIDAILLDRPLSPLDLYDQISNVDYLITMRMHAGIIGKAYGKSVSTLIWDDKIPGVWQEAGDKRVAINSDIILNPHPWNEVKSAFEASNNIQLSDLHRKISISVDKCLKVVYA
jgi:polysaccharide pyruvyl transferase WcaK-like protein